MSLNQSPKPKRDASYYTFAFIRVALALSIAFIISQFRFDYIEALFYDARVRFTPAPQTSGKIELIAVDPLTVEKNRRVPSAVDHLQLLETVTSANPRAIIYLLSPNEIVGSQVELERLAKKMMNTPNFFIAVQDVALKGQENVYTLLPPFEKLTPMSAPKTTDNSVFAGDGVTRRIMISYQGQSMIYPVVAGLFNPAVKDEKNIRGLFEYLQSSQVYIDFHPARTYPTHSFVDVQTSLVAPTKFADKVVIIGRDIQSTSKDYIMTPYSRDVVAMSVLEMNANMIDTLIKNSAPVQVPSWFNFLITGLISIFTIYLVLAVKPTTGLVWLGSAIAAFSIFSYLAFWLGGLWVGMAHPFLAIFICYYFFIPYRLIVENRRSWEYLQKNRLLTQVEELKTNFLSMMSHDLKTPIARIQGMTDIVLKDSNALSELQKEALDTLSKSTEELLDFVSSILNLGRIESKELKLHMKSRDPNTLISEVVEKLGYLARSKGISVKAELEPMFSLKMDTDLMRQVFTNLIENAIKYSPENTSILVTSEERDGRVIIQVADQGMGIPEEELPHVFTKFYRSRNAKSSQIKGSGLGLYLAKYFVELHRGSIAVDSRSGEGSTFTVELPTDLAVDQTGS
ncbi:MAG TPA: ATP-binding protein [Bdellovibrionales bacterium]|nr:ATP-binding protein [Bdellovibrionales bacterium]